MELITDTLILKTVDDNDIDEVSRMWDWQNGIISTDKAYEAIRYMQDNHKKNKQGYIHHLCFAVFQRCSNRIIGWCGLDGQCSPGKIVLFYSIDTGYQNKGYATQCTSKLFEYAFENAGLQSIYGGCYKDNIASWRVMEKAGMSLYEFDKDDGGPHFYIDKEIYYRYKNRAL